MPTDAHSAWVGDPPWTGCEFTLTSDPGDDVAGPDRRDGQRHHSAVGPGRR
jgi:hypothetical protein